MCQRHLVVTLRGTCRNSSGRCEKAGGGCWRSGRCLKHCTSGSEVHCCRENFHHRATVKRRVEWVKALLFSASASCTHAQHGAPGEFQGEAQTQVKATEGENAGSPAHRFFFSCLRSHKVYLFFYSAFDMFLGKVKCSGHRVQGLYLLVGRSHN